ncbi:AzlD domain-containing protein [Duganella sp. LX20W]|uniref:AzlD domain-containing protein n=1 Tax=Rugamonas brunnea TaxID=2758569 RepID=A0A7W2ENN3_9BURK|nr:AzlD domain-containing protein [Rugamonas brunnea]MBA5635778.1 AzlD domain-containing protein [Rugamonas brunnea]
MELFWIFAVLGLGTFLPRYLPLALWGERELPLVIRKILVYVPVAILTAIFVPEVVMPEGRLFLHWSNAYLVGGLATMAVMMLSKRLLLSSAIGIVAFALMRHFS